MHDPGLPEAKNPDYFLIHDNKVAALRSWKRLE